MSAITLTSKPTVQSQADPSYEGASLHEKDGDYSNNLNTLKWKCFYTFQVKNNSDGPIRITGLQAEIFEYLGKSGPPWSAPSLKLNPKLPITFGRKDEQQLPFELAPDSEVQVSLPIIRIAKQPQGEGIRPHITVEYMPVENFSYSADGSIVTSHGFVDVKPEMYEPMAGVVSIASLAQKDRYLRMDPTGVPPRGGNGGGVVNVQNRVGSLEAIKINPLGSGLYSLELASKPGFYLRMYVEGVPPRGGDGGGTVNIQNRVGSLEKFRLNMLRQGIYSIESAANPGFYLRMDPYGVPPNNGNGGGTVNVQNRVGSLEQFRFVLVD